jgi:hypothetical protein
MTRLNCREANKAQAHTSVGERRMRREISRSGDPDVRAKLQAKLDAHLKTVTPPETIIKAIDESVKARTVSERLARIFKRLRDIKLRELLRKFMQHLAIVRTKTSGDLHSAMKSTLEVLHTEIKILAPA